jgi:hypothetical protein
VTGLLVSSRPDLRSLVFALVNALPGVL